MRPRLLSPDSDFDVDSAREPARLDVDRFADLELDAIARAMGGGDEFVHDIAVAVLHHPLADPDVIRYRQAAVVDALANATTIRELYAAPIRALDEAKKAYGWGLFSPSGVVHHSVAVLRIHLRHLRGLRESVRTHAAAFSSPAFADLFARLERDLSDDWLAQVSGLLNDLTFLHGLDGSAGLAGANKAAGITLGRPPLGRPPLLVRLGFRRPDHTLTLADRDEAGYNALTELKDRALDPVADALGRATEHITGFWNTFRAEIAFYVGAIALRDALAGLGGSVAIPTITTLPGFRCDGLYDAALVLLSKTPAVGNTLQLDEATVTVITGANRGGKSTFLRSLGQATLLAHCGLPVPAEAFATGLHRTIRTHFTREEDSGRRSGRLDEELARMSAVVGETRRGGIVLLNESFASTNEREGSAIARTVVDALRDSGVSVVFVTHLYDFAARAAAEGRDDTAFVRAGREEDGHRDFRIRPGVPLPTGFGADLYADIFGEPLERDDAEAGIRSPGG